MEEEMVSGAVNEEEVECTFTAYEIDLDYEFDAARFFDFERDESPLETRQAELWFDSAGSYPPSPFVVKLVPREELLMGSIHISPKSKGEESMNLSESNSDLQADCEVPHMEMEYGGSLIIECQKLVPLFSTLQYKIREGKLVAISDLPLQIVSPPFPLDGSKINTCMWSNHHGLY